MMSRAAWLLLAGLALGGCIFAPSKCGPRGFVRPGSAQYQRYLANCRRASARLDEACAKFGEPDAIQIGHSAGIFAWRQPRLLLRVGSFGRTTELPYVPKKWVRYLSESAALEQMPPPPVAKSPAPAEAEKASAAEPLVKIQTLDYDPDTRKGRISVTFAEGHYAEARRWTRKNIETLARDKNVALRTGEIPGAAKFYLGAERVKAGNVLEIEFETE